MFEKCPGIELFSSYNAVLLVQNIVCGSRAVDGKRFLESNSSSIRGTYIRLGQVKIPRIEEAFDSRNLLPSTSIDPCFQFETTFVS